jgi:hypothetical protein
METDPMGGTRAMDTHRTTKEGMPMETDPTGGTRATHT